MQLVDDEFAENFDFDILDATKILPEELLPAEPVGRMVLNQTVDNFFAETEQVAFCTQNVVPGIDFTNGPLLRTRGAMPDRDDHARWIHGSRRGMVPWFGHGSDRAS